MDVVNQPRRARDGVVGPQFGGVLEREGREIERVSVHEFHIVARVTAAWTGLVITEVGSHPRRACAVVVCPEFVPGIVGDGTKENLRAVLNAQPISGETAQSAGTDIGHHPHLIGGGVVGPQLFTVNTIVGAKVEGVFNGQFHALVGGGFASVLTGERIGDHPKALSAAVGCLVVNFTGFKHAITCRTALVSVVKTEGKQTTSSRTAVGFAQPYGITQHGGGGPAPAAAVAVAPARASVAIGSVLPVGSIANIGGLINFINGQVAVVIVVNTHVQTKAPFLTMLAGIVGEGLNKGRCPVGSVGAVESVDTIGAIEPVQPVHAVGAVEALHSLLALWAFWSFRAIHAIAHAP